MFASSLVRVLRVHRRREEKVKILSQLAAIHSSCRSHNIAATSQPQIRRKPPHVPVMANEVLEHLQPLDSSQIIVDMTFGAGGHTKRILDSAGDGVRVIALDRGNIKN